MTEHVMWSPDTARRDEANLSRFVECLAARCGLQFDSYSSLHRWSIEQPEAFWFELAHFVDMRAEWSEGPVVVEGDKMPGAHWFPGARLNFAENLLRFHDDHPALLATNERGQRRALSYKQLYSEVGRIAAGLRDAGVKPGDRVAGFMPNLPETVIAMLAATSLGATWSS